MRKLKLDVEQLAVESFATAADGVRWGTVRAASDEEEEVLEPVPGDGEVAILSLWTCKTQCNQDTCDITCARTCATCNDPTCDSCFITRCRDNCA